MLTEEWNLKLPEWVLCTVMWEKGALCRTDWQVLETSFAVENKVSLIARLVADVMLKCCERRTWAGGFLHHTSLLRLQRAQIWGLTTPPQTKHIMSYIKNVFEANKWVHLPRWMWHKFISLYGALGAQQGIQNTYSGNPNNMTADLLK